MLHRLREGLTHILTTVPVFHIIALSANLEFILHDGFHTNSLPYARLVNFPAPLSHYIHALIFEVTHNQIIMYIPYVHTEHLNGQRTTDNGQRTTDIGHRTSDIGHRVNY